MLVKLRGNIGDEATYYAEDGIVEQSKIIYVDITVFAEHYDANYVLENSKRISHKSIIDIQHRPQKDIEVLDTTD